MHATTIKARIAKAMGLPITAIKRIEKWANCIFAVVKNLGGRFVSYKVTTGDKPMTNTPAPAPEKTIEEALEAVGRRWQKHDMDRIYFSDLWQFIGLELEFYKTGNICSAKLNGKVISNSQARGLYNPLAEAKCWWDVPTQTFKWRYDRAMAPDQDLRDQVVRGICDAVAHQPLYDIVGNA